MIGKLAARAYLQLRGRPLESTVPLSILIELATRRTVAAFRGFVHASLYGSSAVLHFRESRVSVIYAKNLRIGRGVTFSHGCLIDCFSEYGIQIGDNVTVGRGAMIRGSGVIAARGQGVKIGSRSAIGSNNVIWGQGSVQIGQDCLFGPNVTIVSENHNYQSRDIPIRAQGETRGKVVIGDDCWLASGVTVTAGVTIGRGAVIGAGAVVTRDIPAYSIAVGIPACVVGSR